MQEVLRDRMQMHIMGMSSALILSSLFLNSLLSRSPHTPERTQQNQRDRDHHLRELQMTSPSARRTRQRAPPQGNIPQPDFLQGSSLLAVPIPQGLLPPVYPALFNPPYPPPPLLQAPPLPLPPLPPNYHPGHSVFGLRYSHHPQYPYGYQPAAPVPMPMQVPAHHPRHAPVPVQGYPGLPRHAIAHHDR